MLQNIVLALKCAFLYPFMHKLCPGPQDAFSTVQVILTHLMVDLNVPIA